VKTVAMQLTGVYWISLYDILEERGFEVYLVNARHSKDVPGRKSDVQECQWVLKSHTYGPLSQAAAGQQPVNSPRWYAFPIVHGALVAQLGSDESQSTRFSASLRPLARRCAALSAIFASQDNATIRTQGKRKQLCPATGKITRNSSYTKFRTLPLFPLLSLGYD
jgi:hypothetical protein